MSRKVFISYSTKDITLIEGIRDTVESKGIRCWMAPRDIVPGSEYAASIIDAIEACETFIVFFTAASNDSVQVQKEVDRAINGRKRILVFKLEDVTMTKTMEYYLCDVHWLDATHGNIDKGIKELVNSIKSPPQDNLPKRKKPSPERPKKKNKKKPKKSLGKKIALGFSLILALVVLKNLLVTGYKMNKKLYTQEYYNKKSLEKLHVLESFPLAVRGYDFEDTVLRKYYQKKLWYRVKKKKNIHEDPPWDNFNETEHENLARIYHAKIRKKRKKLKTEFYNSKTPKKIIGILPRFFPPKDQNERSEKITRLSYEFSEGVNEVLTEIMVHSIIPPPFLVDNFEMHELEKFLRATDYKIMLIPVIGSLKHDDIAISVIDNGHPAKVKFARQFARLLMEDLREKDIGEFHLNQRVSSRHLKHLGETPGLIIAVGNIDKYDEEPFFTTPEGHDRIRTALLEAITFAIEKTGGNEH